MPSAKPGVNIEQQTRDALNTLIGEHVIHLLGRPADLFAVQVRRLWDDRFRANVFVGADAASATVACSFFLVADSEGKILASNPAIAKVYDQGKRSG